jgi:hypothetical protein
MQVSLGVLKPGRHLELLFGSPRAAENRFRFRAPVRAPCFARSISAVSSC